MRVQSNDIRNLFGLLSLRADRYKDKDAFKKLLNIHKSIDEYDHEVKTEIEGIEYFSRKEGKKHAIVLKRKNQEVHFWKKKDKDFTVVLGGKGDIIDLILNFCSENELKEVKKDLYLLSGKQMLKVKKRKKKGYFLIDPVTETTMRALTSIDLYKMYSSTKQVEFEDKIVMAEE